MKGNGTTNLFDSTLEYEWADILKNVTLSRIATHSNRSNTTIRQTNEMQFFYIYDIYISVSIAIVSGQHNVDLGVKLLKVIEVLFSTK